MESLISNLDLRRFNTFLRGEPGKDYWVIDDSLPPLDVLFAGSNYYQILFKPNPGSAVGHWVVLIKFDETEYEYFDCLGDEVPPQVLKLFECPPFDIWLSRSGRSLMAKNGTICGRWVIFRLFCLPNPLGDFLTFFRNRKDPDKLVRFIVNIPMLD